MYIYLRIRIGDPSSNPGKDSLRFARTLGHTRFLYTYLDKELLPRLPPGDVLMTSMDSHCTRPPGRVNL